MHISRHTIDKQAMAVSYKAYQRLERDAVTEFMSDMTVVEDLSGYLIHLFYYSGLFEDEVEKTLDWLDLYIAASVVKYTLAVNIGTSARFEFMSKTYELVPPEKDYGVAVTDWIEIYLAAIARGNNKAIDQLAAIDLDEVRRQQTGKSFEYSFLFAQFLRHLFDKGVDHGDNLAKASEASMEVPKSSLLYDYMLDIAGPQIDLFSCILYKDEEKFNNLLKEALLSYKNYYEREEEQGKKDPFGLVSIPLSAIVRVAKEEGLTIQHTSDYLPPYLTDHR
jgi:hypothetical protein